MKKESDDALCIVMIFATIIKKVKKKWCSRTILNIELYLNILVVQM